ASDTEPPHMDIRVKELAGLDMQRAVTGGIPIAKGSAPKGSQFVLIDDKDRPVPCQTEVLATWDDGSARWVLLDFQAKPRAMDTEHFRLTWGPGSKTINPPDAIKVTEKNGMSISSGDVTLRTVPGTLLRISDRFDVKLVLTDRSGNRCEAVVASS